MHIHVKILDKETHATIKEKSLHFEQPMPIAYVLSCYMGQTLWSLSYDPSNQVQITKDGTMWQQETL